LVQSLFWQITSKPCLDRLTANMFRSVACFAACTLPILVEGQAPSLFGLRKGVNRFRSLFSNAKDSFHAAFAATPCTGEACCAESRCWSSAPAMFGCRASRGETECVGSKMFPMPHTGTCSCSQGPCGTNGECSKTTQALYEVSHESPIPPEDFTASFLIVGSVSMSLLLVLVSFVLRKWRTDSRQFQRQASPVDDSDANVE